MAYPSVGGAIASGHESGIRTGMALRGQEEELLRRKGLDARQALLDQQHQQDRQRLIDRQDSADQEAAITGQMGDLRTQAEGHASGIAPLSTEQQAQLASKTSVLAAQREKGRVKRGGVDFGALKKQTDADQAAVTAKQLDIAQLDGDRFGRLITQASGGIPASAFVRQNGQPSQVESWVEQVHSMMNGGDKKSGLDALNNLLVGSRRKGIGEKSPHGGTIIDKRIADVHMDPNSPPDDPRVVPMLQVFVNNGKAEASGDEMRARRAMAEGVPQGATGHYLAPVTENRSSDPNDAVKSISLKGALDHFGQYLGLVDAINTPQGLQKIQEAYATPGRTPDDWAQAMATLGVKKRAVDETVQGLGAHGLAKVRTNPDGSKSVEVVPGTQRPAPAPRGTDPLSKMQFQLDEIDAAEQEAMDAGTLTAAQRAGFDAERRAVRSGIKPGRYSGGLAGGGGGPASGSGLAERKVAATERKNDLASLDKDVDAADKRVDNARASLSAHVKDKPENVFDEKQMASWRAEHDRLRAKVDKAESAHEEAITAKKTGQAEYQRAKAAADEEATKPGKPAAKSGQQPKKIASDAEFHALPSGAVFIDPNGVKRRKP